jgi:hypothetical protein
MLKSMNSRFFVLLCLTVMLAWAPASQARTVKKKLKTKSVVVAKKSQRAQ